jgi:ArsR family transcriptional regulator
MMTQECTDSIAGECADLADALDPRLFRALGDANRIALLVQIGTCGEATSVSEAAECCPVDVSVVSRHLAVLRDAGVVRAERQGRRVHYSVPHADLAATLRGMADAIEACCPPECCPPDAARAGSGAPAETAPST